MSKLGGWQHPDMAPAVAKAFSDIARRLVDGTVDRVVKHKLVNTANSTAISGTAAPTDFSIVYPASTSLYVVGRILKIMAGGFYSSTGTPTLEIGVRIGGTVIIAFTAKNCINNAVNESWRFDMEIITRSLGVTGTVMAQGTEFFNTQQTTDEVETIVTTSAITVNTTIPQNLNIYARWNVASASNTTTLANYVLMLSDY